MNSNKSLSSANKMVHFYFNEAREILLRIENGEIESNKIHEKIAVIMVLLVAGVEAFLNTFFYILSEERDNKELLNEVESGKRGKQFLSIPTKILTWPKIVFSKNIDPKSKVYKDFDGIRKLRNRLFHYKGDIKTYKVDDIVFEGLHDTTFFSNLSVENGKFALFSSENIIGEIGVLMGSEKKHFLHYWVGRVPDY